MNLYPYTGGFFTVVLMDQTTDAQFRDYSIFTGFWYGSRGAFVV
jgi:hypothetical protein